MSTGKLLLQATGICKKFSGVVALDHVSLDAKAGEIHAIAGENGAGKSTLIKILTGAYTPDEGKIIFDGEEMIHTDPRRAMQAGIACIYQELNLIPHLTVTENIFLGREYRLVGHTNVLDRSRMRKEVGELMRELGLAIDPDARIATLGVGQQQMVEIARSVRSNAKLIIMDEPTSSLSEKDAEELFRIVHRIKARGVAVLFISHRLDEMKNHCDRVTILRDGSSVATLKIAETSVDEIIKLMVGRDITNKYPKVKATWGDVVLAVEGLTRKGVLHDISFELHAGEVLGLAGLVGSGRTETARVIAGADPLDKGRIKVFGKEVRIREPRDSIDAGIAFLTENRKEQGLILIQSVEFNSTMVKMEQYAKGSILDLAKLKAMTEKMATGLRLRAASVKMPVGQLSGGNQQKVVIAKWLLSHAKIFIFDEPTRGIDVGAKVEVYRLINELVAGGAGIIIICSEMDEVLGMADRILVMHEGRITANMMRSDATQEKIMYAASNVSVN
ncbi:sugar ABC transporter ATP-binding protein [Consotaella salsifontis]|uniref:Ribose transport system ATP-binding protein n=1 Tax=Consotaella salsifontis TaxID=1365950 RepID=A0A1T4RM52_9HYPH|nr:sugar ABC transporter ATP-binding protein [Consotaella salsifontis]SKA16977.1 ribose transport system ATP-binding protein [Consotaella salsifontis]